MKTEKNFSVIREVILTTGILAVLLFVSGCKSRTVYVPVEKVKTEHKDRYLLDSIYYRDTVRIVNRGDTVFKDVVRWRERFVKDTIRYERVDTIPVIVEKEVPVNYLTKWQRIRLHILTLIVGIIFIYLVLKLRKLFR